MIAWVLAATLALCWAATAINWKLDERRHQHQLALLRNDLEHERMANVVHVQDDVRLENLRITYEARQRQLTDDHEAELRAAAEVAESWRQRCEQLKREAS